MTNQLSLPARDPKFDNIKGLLIVLVALGHVIQKIPEQNGWRGPGAWAALYCGIYLFHMPAFAFISGCLSSPRKTILAHTRELFCLYLICQAIWCGFLFVLSLCTAPRPSCGHLLFTLPGNGLWYLLSLFIWRVSTPLLEAVRVPRLGLLFLVGYGAMIGLNPNIGEEMTLSRLFAFAPFFAAGFWCRRDSWRMTGRDTSAYDWVLLGSAGVATAFVLFEAYHRSTDLLTLTHPYYFTGWQFRGVAFRLALYLAAFGAIRAIFLLIPESAGLLTKLGFASLSIYIGHFYVVELAQALIDNRFWMTHMPWLAPILTAVCCALFAYWPIGDRFRSYSDWLFDRIFQSTKPKASASQIA